MKKIIAKMGMLSILNTLLSVDKRNSPSQLSGIKDKSICGRFVYIENFAIDYDTYCYKLEVKNEKQYENLLNLLADKYPIVLELERCYLKNGIDSKILYKSEIIEASISVNRDLISIA